VGKLLKADGGETKLEERVRARLALEWAKIFGEPTPAFPELSPEVQSAIRRSINPKTKTYRYVLPTQLLSKLVNERLDCRSVQSGSGLSEAFDARSICHGVIVPFDRENHNVLGGSSEPYLNNPLRIPAIVPAARKAQKDKEGFDDLINVLTYAQKHSSKILSMATLTLYAIQERLADVSVVYPVPNRASLLQTQQTIGAFLADRSGGLRMQAVAMALFESIGQAFKLFTSVRGGSVNAADASTGQAADFECVDDEGKIVLAVEVKDRQIELRQIQDKLPAIREKGIRELLFLGPKGGEEMAKEESAQLINREFASGQNLYLLDWDEFLGTCLMLFGESRRRAFLENVGSVLDALRLDLAHRRRWAELLGEI
jgi:hypothetical protein